MPRTRRIVSTDFKLRVLSENYSGNASKYSNTEKYGIKSAVNDWIKELSIDSELLSLSPEIKSGYKMKHPEEKPKKKTREDELQSRNRIWNIPWPLSVCVPMHTSNS